jgi:hypothetical protein
VGKAEPFPALRREGGKAQRFRACADCPQIHGHSGLPLFAPRLRGYDPSVPAQRFYPSGTPLLKKWRAIDGLNNHPFTRVKGFLNHCGNMAPEQRYRDQMGAKTSR